MSKLTLRDMFEALAQGKVLYDTESGQRMRMGEKDGIQTRWGGEVWDCVSIVNLVDLELGDWEIEE